MVKTFGRNRNNTNPINKQDISDFHARITALPNDEFLVEDRGAVEPGQDTTNGTFINGYRILQATVSADDEVRLSDDTVIDLRQIFGLRKPVEPLKKDVKDFTVEFGKLREVYDKFQAEKLKVRNRHNLKTSLIRGAFTILPLIVFEILKNMFDQSTPEGIRHMNDFSKDYIVFSVLGSTIGVMATGTMSPEAKLNQLDESFRVQYVCPDCKLPLGNVPWLNYEQQGKCFRCLAIYKK